MGQEKDSITDSLRYLNDVVIDESAIWLPELKGYLQFLLCGSFLTKIQVKAVKSLIRNSLSTVVHEISTDISNNRQTNILSESIKSGTLAVGFFIITTIIVLFLLGRIGGAFFN